jgi:ABC-type uncharacterized transport system permease subunit
MPSLILPLLAALLYLAAAFALALPSLGRESLPRSAGLGLAGIAVLTHGITVFAAGGPDLHFFAALSAVALLVAALTLLVNIARPVAGLGVIVFPLAAMLLLIDAFLAPHTQPLALDWQIKLHVVVALLAYAVLSIAALLAILLAVQERALRQRHAPALVRILPPLTLTEALLFRLIAAGFLLLTLTLLTGVLFVDNLFAQHLWHKTVLSLVAWLVFGALLFGRWRYGWRGKRAVRLTLAGMSVLLLAFFGSKFVLELVLHRSA